MKKFISALSSFVIAATAMGGTLAFTSSAAVNGSVDKTIIAIRSDGKNSVNVKAGDTVPVKGSREFEQKADSLDPVLLLGSHTTLGS